MVNFPFSPFPYYYNNYNHFRTINHYPNRKSTIPKDETLSINNSSKSETSHYNYINLSNLFSGKTDQAIIELFGIKLFLDDIIIIFLLFFLYNEGVKDDILFIILFLLLFTE